MKKVTRELSSSLKFTSVANSIGTSVEYSFFNLAVSLDPPFYATLAFCYSGGEPLGVLAADDAFEDYVFFFF
jgi:hypothetical protein